jgi:hypothetical protein
MHLHGFPTYGKCLVCSLVNRDNGRLINYNFIFIDNKGIRGAKVHGNVAGEKIKKSHLLVENKG